MTYPHGLTYFRSDQFNLRPSIKSCILFNSANTKRNRTSDSIDLSFQFNDYVIHNNKFRSNLVNSPHSCNKLTSKCSGSEIEGHNYLIDFIPH